MVEVDLQTVTIAVASAGMFAAAIYYIFQIRHQTRSIDRQRAIQRVQLGMLIAT